jgi:hypothetical protein
MRELALRLGRYHSGYSKYISALSVTICDPEHWTTGMGAAA